MNTTMLIKTFRNTALAALYIFAVSQVMAYGEQWFGKEDNNFTPFVVLMLFSLSAAVVGGLVLGESLYLFFEHKKDAGIQAALYSIGWLAMYTLIGFIVLALIK